MSRSAASLQYSDLETYEVTVTGANGEAPAQGVNFKVGTQVMNGATPVPFVHQGGAVWNGCREQEAAAARDNARRAEDELTGVAVSALATARHAHTRRKFAILGPAAQFLHVQARFFHEPVPPQRCKSPDFIDVFGRQSTCPDCAHDSTTQEPPCDGTGKTRRLEGRPGAGRKTERAAAA